jgi:hypothetical protein
VLSVVVLSVVMLSVVMLSVVKLSVIMLSVVVPYRRLDIQHKDTLQNGVEQNRVYRSTDTVCTVEWRMYIV